MVKVLILIISVYYSITTTYAAGPSCPNPNPLFDSASVTSSSLVGPNKSLTITSCSCLPVNTFNTIYSYDTIIIGGNTPGTLTICDNTGGTDVAPIRDVNQGLYIRAKSIEIKTNGTLSVSGKSAIPNTFSFTTTKGLTSGGQPAITVNGAAIPSEQDSSYISTLSNDTTSCLPLWYHTLLSSSYVNLKRPGSVVANSSGRPYCANGSYLNYIQSVFVGSVDYNFACSSNALSTAVGTDMTNVNGTYKYSVVAPATTAANNTSLRGEAGGAVACKANDNGTILGGLGGGFLFLEVGTFIIRSNGLLEASGLAGSANNATTNGGGSGGGGSVFIKANTVNIESNAVIDTQGNGGLWWSGQNRSFNSFGATYTFLTTGSSISIATGIDVGVSTDYFARVNSTRPSTNLGVTGPVIFVYGTSYTNNGTMRTSYVLNGQTTGVSAPIVIKDLWSPGHSFFEGSGANSYNPMNTPFISVINSLNGTYYINNYLNYEASRRIASNSLLFDFYWLQIDTLSIQFKNKSASALYFPFNSLQVNIEPNKDFGDTRSYTGTFCFTFPSAVGCGNNLLESTRAIRSDAWNLSFVSPINADSFKNGSYNFLLDRFDTNAVVPGLLGGPFTSNMSFPLFSYRNNSGAIDFNLRYGTIGYNQGASQLLTPRANTLFFDSYAPCDDILNDFCSINILNILSGSSKQSTNTFITNSPIGLRLQLTIRPNGGTMQQTGTPNVRVLVAGQRGNQLIDKNGTSIAKLGTIINEQDVNVNTALGKSCQELFFGEPGNADRSGNWSSFLSSSVAFTYNGFNLLDNSNWAGLESIINDTLKKVAAVNNQDCTANCDGTIYLLFCFRDDIGNWSRVIQYSNSKAYVDVDRKNGVNFLDLDLIDHNSYKGILNPRTLYPYQYSSNTCNNERDNIFECYNDTTYSLEANVPTSLKRIYFDSSGSDDPNNPDCASSDPCPILKLSNINGIVPRFIAPGEVGGNIRIAFAPYTWTNQSSIQVGLKLPSDKSGIKKIYYYKGASPPIDLNIATAIEIPNNIPSDICNTVRLANITNTTTPPANWLDYCFTINNITDNESVYITLEDGAGNRSLGNFITRRFFIDTIKPQSPSDLRTEENFVPISNPKLYFKSSLDQASFSVGVIGSGIKEYKICYWEESSKFTLDTLKILNNNTPGSCPQSSDIDYGVANSIIFQPNSTKTYQEYQFVNLPCCARWNIVMYALDNAGNYSLPSNILQFVNTDGSPRITFTREKYDYIVGGVSPRLGTTGLYTFKVRYIDVLDTIDNRSIPTKTEVWIDFNSDKKYDDSEKLLMNRLVGENLYGDGNYANGEDFYLSTQLKYNKQANGVITYKFVFVGKNNLSAKTQETSSVDATREYSLILDPYNSNDIIGYIEVRNNLVTPDSTIFPTILLKTPPNGEFTPIRLIIYDNYHNIIRSLYTGTYNEFGRYIRWNLLDDFGSSVGPGVYNVVYEYDNEVAYKKIVVIR